MAGESANQTQGPSLVVLVRHAETEWSRTRRHTGRTDLPLTDAGRAAARELAPRLSDRTFAAVRASPLARAWDTAALLGFGEPAQRDDDLVEWDYGDYEGITTDEIRRARPGWLLWRDGCPGGEEPADVGARVDRALGRLDDAEGDVLIVAHGHVLRVLAARWLGLPPSEGRLLRLEVGGICELGWEREQRVVVRWNA